MYKYNIFFCYRRAKTSFDRLSANNNKNIVIIIIIIILRFRRVAHTIHDDDTCSLTLSCAYTVGRNGLGRGLLSAENDIFIIITTRTQCDRNGRANRHTRKTISGKQRGGRSNVVYSVHRTLRVTLLYNYNYSHTRWQFGTVEQNRVTSRHRYTSVGVMIIKTLNALLYHRGGIISAYPNTSTVCTVLCFFSNIIHIFSRRSTCTLHGRYIIP